MSYNMVWMCNRLVNLRLLCKGSSDPDPLQVRRYLYEKANYVSYFGFLTVYSEEVFAHCRLHPNQIHAVITWSGLTLTNENCWCLLGVRHHQLCCTPPIIHIVPIYD